MPLIDSTRRGSPIDRFTVSQGDNRLNSQGAALPTVKNRQSLFYTNTIAAGAILQIPSAGTQFYLMVATAPVNIRPSGGSFNGYGPGTGLQLDLVNAFDLLEVQNPNAFSVVFQLFVGFDQYIDKRLYLNNQLTPQVFYPTFPVAAAANVINIPDLAGTAFVDINGNNWFALTRQSILVSNIDSGVTLLLQRAAGGTVIGPAVAAIPPLTDLIVNVSGNYRIAVGGGNVNAIVSEIYTSVAPT